MANIITAGNSTNGGTAITTDTSGTLNIVTGSGSGTTAISVDASQNVGINSTSPSSYYATKLVVAGADEQGITIVNTNGGSANGSLLAFANSTSGASAYNGYVKYHHVSNYMAFGVNAGVERMRIDSSGNLLFGTASLYPNNNSGFTVEKYAGGAYCTIGHNTSAGTGDGYLNFIRNSVVIGGITQNGTANVSYLTSSDYRLKEDVQPMVSALDVVAQLKPCTYKWKSTGEDGQGFIAHELQAVVPDCVIGEKDAVNEDGSIKPQGIDTSFLVATLTAAIQELKAELDAVKAKVGV